MRSVRLGELAVIVLVAAVCLCYAINSRAGATDLEFEETPVLKVEASDGTLQTQRCQCSVPAPKEDQKAARDSKYAARTARQN